MSKRAQVLPVEKIYELRAKHLEMIQSVITRLASHGATHPLAGPPALRRLDSKKATVFAKHHHPASAPLANLAGCAAIRY